MFQVRLPYYMRLNSGRSVSIDVKKTRKLFPESFIARACFLDVSHYLIRETLFPVSVLFPRRKLCLLHTAGNLNKNSSMRAVAKILRAWISKHSSNFCEQFEQRPNFASTFKMDIENLIIETDFKSYLGRRGSILVVIRSTLRGQQLTDKIERKKQKLPFSSWG